MSREFTLHVVRPRLAETEKGKIVQFIEPDEAILCEVPYEKLVPGDISTNAFFLLQVFANRLIELKSSDGKNHKISPIDTETMPKELDGLLYKSQK